MFIWLYFFVKVSINIVSNYNIYANKSQAFEEFSAILGFHVTSSIITEPLSFQLSLVIKHAKYIYF